MCRIENVQFRKLSTEIEFYGLITRWPPFVRRLFTTVQLVCCFLVFVATAIFLFQSDLIYYIASDISEITKQTLLGDPRRSTNVLFFPLFCVLKNLVN